MNAPTYDDLRGQAWREWRRRNVGPYLCGAGTTHELRARRRGVASQLREIHRYRLLFGLRSV